MWASLYREFLHALSHQIVIRRQRTGGRGAIFENTRAEVARSRLDRQSALAFAITAFALTEDAVLHVNEMAVQRIVNFK